MTLPPCGHIVGFTVLLHYVIMELRSVYSLRVFLLCRFTSKQLRSGVDVRIVVKFMLLFADWWPSKILAASSDNEAFYSCVDTNNIAWRTRVLWRHWPHSLFCFPVSNQRCRVCFFQERFCRNAGQLNNLM